MAWTTEQQHAIDARDSSIIVSAAAGSGKTAVLTERLVKLLSDPMSGVRADRIIVVTFTNDAAAELKKRLDSKLRLMIDSDPGNEYLLKQQALLQNAKISTINSFCFDLLRENITDEGITSGFSVLEDTDNEVIRSQAMEELFDWYSSEDYETISFLYDKFCLKSQKPLVTVINEIDRFLASVAMSDIWLNKAVSEYKKPFMESAYGKKLFGSVLAAADTAVKLAEENTAILNDIFPDQTIKAVQAAMLQAHEDLTRAESLQLHARKMTYPDSSELAAIKGFGSLKVIRANVTHNAALRDVFKARRNRLKEIVIGTADLLYSAESNFSETAEVVEKLAEVVKKFQELVWERKCAKNAISFDDGERLALRLLAEVDEDGNVSQSETAKRTAEHYDIIMIDEYQDSNNKEDLIFKLLTKDYKRSPEGRPMYGSNAFLVGDVKQSIYRFRLANPRNFIETMKSSEPYESNAKNRYILLNKNFRSSPEVISFINYVFGEIMSESCGDIDYNDDEKLYYGAPGYGEADRKRLTCINFINTDPVDTEDDDEEVPESPEAEVVAAKIAKMLAEKAPVRLPDGSDRPCTPKDFCVLIRKNKFSKAYVNALENRGVAAKGSEEKGYLRSQEIAILTDLLRIIANPLLDVPMAAVMVSPMFMFSIADLAFLKSCDTKAALFPLIKAAAAGELNGSDPSLEAKCREFIEAIDRFRLDSVTMTIGELIASVYDTTDFISVMQQQTDGEKKRANLRALIRYAQNYEASAAAEGSGGLTGFIRHIDRILESGDYEQGKISASSGDYVTIQTLHKSKGLEYPFVFIAETSSRFKYDSGSVMCSDDGRIGFAMYDKKLMRRYKTFQQKMLQSESKNDSRSEEMRLLYVGLTRAKQQLFIDLCCGEDSLSHVRSLADSCVINSSDISELVGEANCYSDWLWLSLMMHGKFPEIADKIGIPSGQFGFPAHDCEDELFTYEVCEAGSSQKKEICAAEPAKPDDSAIERIKAMIASHYDDSLTGVTAKLSVTQITRKFREDEAFDLQLARPHFLTGTKKLTGAERGTAIHTFFQYCDFNFAAADPAAEIKRLAELGFLDSAQAECISPDKITAFFSSPLYAKISAANEVWREKKFMVAASQLRLNDPIFERISSSDGMIKGIIDLVYETDDGLVIVDYKSDRGMTPDELRERYTTQLEIYKAAVELTTGKKVTGLALYSIELEKEIVIK